MQHYLFVHFREKTSPDGEQVHFAVATDSTGRRSTADILSSGHTMATAVCAI